MFIDSEDTKQIGKMDSTYVTECGYKGGARQPVSLSVLDRQTNFYK